MSEHNPAHRPLSGTTVLEFASILAIPSCGVHLADMGADVIKVEPLTGDPHRYGVGPVLPDESKGFTTMNRGKKGIALDLAALESRQIIKRLVEQADIILMSLKLSDLTKFGLEYEDVKKWNERIIFLEHAPYGRGGPYGQEGGYDVVVQGMSGLASVMARDINGTPGVLTPAVADMATGLASALAVITALRHRDLTGEGQKVSTSLLQTSLILAGNRIHWFAATDPEVWNSAAEALSEAQHDGKSFEQQRDIYTAITNPGGGPATNTYFRYYRATDQFFSVGALSHNLRTKFCSVLGVTDPRTNEFNMSNPDDYDRLVSFTRQCEDIIRGKVAQHWIELFRKNGVPSGPFNFPHQVFDEQQISDNDFILELEHKMLGKYKTYGPAIQMEKTPVFPNSSSPSLGEHTREVLVSLGYVDEEIDHLIKKNIIRQYE